MLMFTMRCGCPHWVQLLGAGLAVVAVDAVALIWKLARGAAWARLRTSLGITVMAPISFTPRRNSRSVVDGSKDIFDHTGWAMSHLLRNSPGCQSLRETGFL